MRDVGDVDAEDVVAVAQDSDFDGIVEILGGLAVDRDYISFTNINTLFYLFLGNF